VASSSVLPVSYWFDPKVWWFSEMFYRNFIDNAVREANTVKARLEYSFTL
jgi:hypothetical protein